jgi:hypothetical protein
VIVSAPVHACVHAAVVDISPLDVGTAVPYQGSLDKSAARSQVYQSGLIRALGDNRAFSARTTIDC